MSNPTRTKSVVNCEYRKVLIEIKLVHHFKIIVSFSVMHSMMSYFCISFGAKNCSYNFVLLLSTYFCKFLCSRTPPFVSPFLLDGTPWYRYIRSAVLCVCLRIDVPNSLRFILLCLYQSSHPGCNGIFSHTNLWHVPMTLGLSLKFLQKFSTLLPWIDLGRYSGELSITPSCCFRYTSGTG